ncbi:MAG TPA: hypothetical protein VMG41_07430 [Gemmatimonadales bacterium]|nr:hypothetical protein [Gemmatimonadales bacterium]
MPSYWRSFTILLRLLGLGATFAGLATITSYGLGWPAPEGESLRLDWPSFFGGGVVTILGVLFLLLPAYRPDLGDTTVVFNPWHAVQGTLSRKWWTGDLRT